MSDAHLIDALIEAGFDEHDRDIGTSGLCATFALALYDYLVDLGEQPIFSVAVVGKVSDDPTKLHWRHALVQHNGRLYDIEGEVFAEHVLDNYCWGTTSPLWSIITLSKNDFLRMVLSTPNAFDEQYLLNWWKKLTTATKTVNMETA